MKPGPEEAPPSHMLARIRRVAWIGVVVAAFGFAVLYGWRAYEDANPPTAKEVARVAINAEFELIDHTGRQVTGETYRGKWLLVFFGFTYCPDICPTTLSVLAETLDALGDDAVAVAPLFISVDPERDTPKVLAEYVSAFHPKLIGLTGSPEQIEAAAKSFKVYYAKMEQKDAPDGYLMGHSGYIYLMTPEGEYEAIFSETRDTPESIAGAVKARIKKGN